MSTYLGAKKDNALISPDDLRHYFLAFAKPESQHMVGLEWELFAVDPESGRALAYSGTRGVEAVLMLLAEHFGYQPLREKGRVIGLSKGGNYVALEPGGQLELSAEPVATVHDIHDQLKGFRDQLLAVSGQFPVSWITCGFQPFSALDEIEWVPKARYDIMREYLAGKGRLAHEMMKRTASVQVNVDYASEQDAMEKIRVIYGVTSLVSALFAHSPLCEGQSIGYATYRMAVWRETDPERTGIVLRLLGETLTFEDYVQYVLDAPMIFLIRGSSWIPMHGMRFRDFLREGKGEFRATRNDFELHLSTLFPEARIKNWIEIRGADGQRFEWVPAVAAWWKGLLYDRESRQASWDLVRDFSPKERLAFHRAMEREGPEAKLGKFRGWDLARELCEIAMRGLRRQRKTNARGEDETVYLDAVREGMLRPEKTPADLLAEKWEGGLRRDRRALLQYLGI